MTAIFSLYRIYIKKYISWALLQSKNMKIYSSSLRCARAFKIKLQSHLRMVFSSKDAIPSVLNVRHHRGTNCEILSLTKPFENDGTRSFRNTAAA